MTRSKAVVLLVAGALLAPVAVRAQDEGLKQVDRLIKVSGETVQSIAEAKLQLERTVTGYNAILAEQAKDRRGAYKDLIKDKDNTQTKVEAVRQRVAGMEQEAKRSLPPGRRTSRGSPRKVSARRARPVWMTPKSASATSSPPESRRGRPTTRS